MADAGQKSGQPGPRRVRSGATYEKRPASRVWTRPGFSGIGYSDGDATERELLALLKRTADIGSNSDELALAIRDWATEAHLSPARANLLRALDFSRCRRVLEIGAGCGALTRYLGERGVEVDAVEGNLLRAECAAERCRDLPGVRVFGDEISSFRSERKYDVVTLVGVLEYAPLFIAGEDPVRACLEMARSHLSEAGVLVLAIENQLGLKYFNGCAEDHLGTPYSGITGLYSSGTAVTFGRARLEARLRDCGFARVDWSFPFPDYKLPTTVVSARALADGEFRAADMLLGEFARDYGGSTLRNFDESAVWRVLEGNALLGDFANSFLVVAAKGTENPLDDGAWLAWRYSPQRLGKLSTATRFARKRRGGIVVSKEFIEPGTARESERVGFDGEFRVRQRVGDQPYVHGVLLAQHFTDAVARGYGARELAKFLLPWIDYLAALSHEDGTRLSARRVSGDYLDCIPTNLVVDDSGKLHPIDLEFAVPGDIPLPWIALRGVVHLASKCFGHRALERQGFKALLADMLPALGFDDVPDWSAFFDLEDHLIRAVLRPWPGRPQSDILRARLELPVCLVHSVLERAQAAARLPPEENAGGLGADLARWLAMLPDPAAADAEPAYIDASAALLEMSERIAAQLPHIDGASHHDTLRALALQRGRWAALARDNRRLASTVNDADERVHALRAELDAVRHAAPTARSADEASESAEALRALKAEVVTLREERNALKWEVRSGLERLEELRSELEGREAVAMEARSREHELLHAVDTLRSDLALRDRALSEVVERERKRSREEGRRDGELSALREERDALKVRTDALSAHVGRLLEQLGRRGSELAHATHLLRESKLARKAAAVPSWRRFARAVFRRAVPVRAIRRRLPANAARTSALAQSGLFDAEWYRQQNPELAGASRDDALWHYVQSGSRGGRNPNPLFHEAWYRERSADTLLPSECGLEHYLRVGAGEGRPPNPLFDAKWYLDVNPDVRAYGAGPFHHFLHFGPRERRSPHPLFDTDWFLRQYPDAARRVDRVNPLAYFFDTVLLNGCSPCESFESDWYLSTYPDVEAARTNPLVHYLEYGAAEGRNPGRGFDTRWYLQSNPDVAASGINPLVHYVVAGRREGRLPMPPARVASPDALLTVQHAAPAPEADGTSEWEDYEPLKQRVAAEVRQALAAVQPAPAKLFTVEEGAIDHVVSQLALPCDDRPQVSIVVPVFNKLALTLECLQSIASAQTALSYEVIVADDGSTDGTAERLAAVPGLLVHRNVQNVGFLRNCNSALPAVNGEFVVLLNNDVQVTDHWLDRLVGTFESEERVGAAGPKIVYPSGHLQEAGVSLREDGSAEMVGLFDDPQRARYNYVRPVDYVSGACLAIRTQLLRELGGFSEDYLPCYCEDSDLCMRVWQRGLRVVYQPAATVYHHLSKTTADAASDIKLRSIAGSVNRFLQTWQEELDRLNKVRVLAFYLPQFHPIPENDHWWGAGFTEWANVTRARPNFVGHYQPRLPADLGFYDLRVPEVMEAQAKLARRYGVHGFCCYYYWFAGKRLLELPVERMLATGRPDIPYCLCWANENWTRRWDGQDTDILVAQHYSPEDDEAVMLDLIRHFRGRNYIRIDGKPLVLVYRVTMFPDFRATAERWRQICRREGVGDIYIAMVESFDLVHACADPGHYNCDASVEFPPLGMAETRPPSGPVTNPEFVGRVADYRDLAARFCARPLPAFTRFRGVMPGWDNTARRQNNSFCFEHSTPGAFQAWLETAIAQTRAQNQGDERIVFVNAWNEWAEGAYLEPDRRYGHAFLEAVRNAQDAQRLLRMNRYALDL